MAKTLQTLQWVTLALIALLIAVVGNSLRVVLQPAFEPPPLTGENLLQNGAFEDGETAWRMGEGISTRLEDDVLVARRSSQQGAATVNQPLEQSISAGATVQLRAQLSNPTNIRQLIRLDLLEPGSDDHRFSCDFLIPSGAGRRTYTLSLRTGEAWQSARVQVALPDRNNTAFPIYIHQVMLEVEGENTASLPCEVVGEPETAPVTYAHMAIVALLSFTSLRVLTENGYDRSVGETVSKVIRGGAWLWVALGVFGMMSALWAVTPAAALYNGLLLLLEVGLGLAIAIMARRGAAVLLCAVFVVAAVPHALIGVAQVIAGGTVGLEAIGEMPFNPANPFLLGPQSFRPYALATHPNVLAAYLSMAVMFGVVAVYGLRPQRGAMLGMGAALLVALVGLLATVARMPLAIVVAVMVPALMFVYRAPRWMWVALVALGVAGLIAIQVIPTSVPVVGTLAQRYRELLSSFDGLIGRIMEGVPNTIAVFQQSPLVGVGLYNLYDTIIFQPPDRHGIHLPAHNVYIVVLAELGIIGGVLYAAGLWLPLRGLFAKDRVRVLLAAVLLAFSLMILFEFLFWLAVAVRPLTFWMLGLLWGVRAQERLAGG